MTKPLDIQIGYRILTYTLIEKIKIKGRFKYKFLCDCGHETIRDSYRIRTIPKCMFCSINSQIGQKKGKLLFLKYLGKSNFEAKCDCGIICIVRRRCISCGCHIKENHIREAEKLIGLRFNDLKILSIKEFTSKGIIFNCRCKCGNLTSVRNGSFNYKKSCGCLQKRLLLRGSAVKNSRFTEIEIHTMKELYISKIYSINEICKMFSVTRNYLFKILQGKSWKHTEIKTEKNIKKSNVFMGKINKCLRYNYEEYIGKQIGSRTLLEVIKNEKEGIKGIFLCKCGDKKTILIYPVITGGARSCHQCSIKYKDYSYLINKKFGTRTIIKITGRRKKQLVGIVKCDCGNEKELLLHHIISGTSINGCQKCFQTYQ
jgi:hypothetical protein